MIFDPVAKMLRLSFSASPRHAISTDNVADRPVRLRNTRSSHGFEHTYGESQSVSLRYTQTTARPRENPI